MGAKRLVRNTIDAWMESAAQENPFLAELLTDKRHCRDTVVRNGQANFAIGFTTSGGRISPAEKSLLYAFFYLPMHLAGAMEIVARSPKLFARCFATPQTELIDIGAGPFTAAIAFAHFHRDNEVCYHAIDSSSEMMALGKRLFKKGKLWPHGWATTRSNGLTRVVPQIEKHSTRRRDTSVIVNFSYVFASPTLDVDEHIALLNEIIDLGAPRRVVLVIQHSASSKKNEKWEEFSAGVGKFGFSSHFGRVAEFQPRV